MSDRVFFNIILVVGYTLMLVSILVLSAMVGKIIAISIWGLIISNSLIYFWSSYRPKYIKD